MTDMIKHLRIGFATLALLCGGTSFASHAIASQPEAWAALREGAIVLFRHANAPGTGDPAGFRPDDCATQRNLDARGRAQARQIGERFRREQIVVNTVLSSEWCRAFDTANLAFPDQVRREPSLNSFFDDRGQAAAQTAAAKRILLDWRGPGTLVVVTHQVNIQALTGIASTEGEGVVLRRDGKQLQTIGRISP